MKSQTRSVLIAAPFLIGLLLLPNSGRAMITSVSITPEQPTSQDTIVFSVEGWFPDGCWSMDGFEFDQPSPNDFTAVIQAVDHWEPDMVCLLYIVQYQYSSTIGPLEPGNYSIHIVENHQSDRDPFPDFATLDFAVVQRCPHPFTPISPASDDTCWTLDTLLTWERTTDPDPFDLPFYDVWLDTLPDLNSAWLIADSIADTSIAVTEMRDDHAYYWTVRATDSNTSGTWADDTLMFHTYYPEAPSSFALIEPTDGTELAWETISFRWASCIDPDPGDHATYTLKLLVEGDSVSLGDVSGTMIDLDPNTLSILEGGAEVLWCVTAHTTYPDTTIESQSRFSFTLQPSASEIKPMIVPQDYYLSQNYPNPFNSSTTIEFGLPNATHVSICIYDVIGRQVEEVLSGSIPAGRHSINWNCAKYSSGIYLIEMETPEFSAIKKAMFLR